MSGEQDMVIPERILKRALGNLHEAHPKDVKVLSSEVSAGSNKGDNFMCIMKRVHVKSEVRGVPHKDSLIVKCYPAAGYWVEMLHDNCMFRNEVTCYNEIFPKLNGVAEQTGLESIKIPKCYLADNDEGFLVMEDLKEQGFVIEDKSKGLDLPHVKMALDKLANFHAISYHWIENYFGGLERFKKDFWTCNGDGWILSETGTFEEFNYQWLASIFSMFYEVLNFYSMDPELIERFQTFEKNRRAQVNPTLAPQGKFNCLIHNDAWCNNFMYRDDCDGNPVDFRTFDFQLSRRSRPTIDLVYCFVSSMTPAMREQHTDELLAYYHNSLTSLLTHLGYKEDLYTLSDLKADYEDCFAFGFVMALMHCQLQLTDPAAEGNFDVNEMADEETKKKQLDSFREFQKEQARTNKKLSERMLLLADEAQRMGVI